MPTTLLKKRLWQRFFGNVKNKLFTEHLQATSSKNWIHALLHKMLRLIYQILKKVNFWTLLLSDLDMNPISNEKVKIWYTMPESAKHCFSVRWRQLADKRVLKALSNICDGAFAKIVNSFYPLPLLRKNSALNVWHGPKNVFGCCSSNKCAAQSIIKLFIDSSPIF